MGAQTTAMSAGTSPTPTTQHARFTAKHVVSTVVNPGSATAGDLVLLQLYKAKEDRK